MVLHFCCLEMILHLAIPTSNIWIISCIFPIFSLVLCMLILKMGLALLTCLQESVLMGISKWDCFMGEHTAQKESQTQDYFATWCSCFLPSILSFPDGSPSLSSFSFPDTFSQISWDVQIQSYSSLHIQLMYKRFRHISKTNHLDSISQPSIWILNVSSNDLSKLYNYTIILFPCRD